MKPALLLMLPIHLRPAKHARAPETQVHLKLKYRKVATLNPRP